MKEKNVFVRQEYPTDIGYGDIYTEMGTDILRFMDGGIRQHT
jgi:hypothetical protein